jgi:hypothetical protein
MPNEPLILPALSLSAPGEGVRGAGRASSERASVYRRYESELLE